jgi:hypothetical protein
MSAYFYDSQDSCGNLPQKLAALREQSILELTSSPYLLKLGNE